MVPTRNSSSIGASSGAVSSTSAGVTAGTPASPAVRRTTSSSSASTRSASTATCCFSSATLVVRPRTAGLQEEGALPGLADRARDEALGRVVLEDDARHAIRPYVVTPSRAVPAPPAPPPTSASESPPCAGAVRFVRGTRKPRSPPTSLARTTNGRSGV